MRHLNYSHLQYFWVVAKEGSISRAAETLSLTPQTISGQLKLLDEDIGARLFRRSGRNLVLTDIGERVFQYADEIFEIGAELAMVARNRQELLPSVLNVGIVNSIPKLIAQRTLSPAFSLDIPIKIVCREDSLKQLLGKLAVHEMDLVISDQAMPSGINVKAYAHRLGSSGISFFVREEDTTRYATNFPKNLNGAPLLLPSDSSKVRRELDEWLKRNELTPNVIAEFDDSALLKALGEAGAGVFPAPTAIENEIQRMYRATVIGRTADIREKFYAITPERRLKHPAVIAITDQAREKLFMGD